jgi:hypothetical protein
MVEERGGLGRGMLNSPDLKPQADTKTKFADVKGVDEAKASRPFLPCLSCHAFPAFRSGLLA